MRKPTNPTRPFPVVADSSKGSYISDRREVRFQYHGVSIHGHSVRTESRKL